MGESLSAEAAGVSPFGQKVMIRLGGLAVSSNRDERLTTSPLGSCLGVTIYDPMARVGGVLHAMLPDSGFDPAQADARPGMFADTGIAALLDAAAKLGLDKTRARIGVAGCAQILDEGGFFNIGSRNLEAASRIIALHGLVIEAGQAGGMTGKSMRLNIGTGEVRLMISGQSAEIILMKGCP